MISTVTLNPALDKCIYVNSLLSNDTNRILKVETDVGGKGINVSRVLKELGTETMALGFVGGQTGRFIEHVLKEDGIGVDFVHVDSETRTNFCIQDSTGAPPTTFNESGPQVTDRHLDELFARVRRVAAKSQFVAFGGSLPPSVPKNTYKTLVEIVSEAGSRAILDSDGEQMQFGMEAVPFMIKPNRDEVKRLANIEIHTLEDAAHAADILAQTGIDYVVISMGAEGAVARSKAGVWFAASPDIKPVSTIGSGDSMVAGIAHILGSGGSLEEALRWGSAAGTATAMTDGTEICRRTGILDLLAKVHVRQL